MSTEGSDRPKRRGPQFIEGELSGNEMFRGMRRTVSLPLQDPSDADWKELHERQQHSEQKDLLNRLLDNSYLDALDRKLDELDFPPIRGWVQVEVDESWARLSDEDVAELPSEHERLIEGFNPDTGLRIEPGVNYTKRRAEPFSPPWWFAHIGDLIIRVRCEQDLERLLVLTFTLGQDYQRYMDQLGHLPMIQHGKKFSSSNTENAGRARGRKSTAREKHVAEMAEKWLAEPNTECTTKDGRINKRAVARKYRQEFGTYLSEKRITELLSKRSGN